MAQQLVKKSNGSYEKIMPKSWIDAIVDKSTGKTLTDILQSFNMYFLSYSGNTMETRCQVPSLIRKKGLWITYVKYDGKVYTEWYASSAIDDKSWGDSSNWRVANNTLVGDISISANGNWVINGYETTQKAIGERGDTPMLRVYDNKLQVSYDEGDTWTNVTENPVYTKFRWAAESNNVGRVQASTDDGKTWNNLSNDFTNNLHIARYIGADETPPTSGVAEGTIYAKGPFYDDTDTLQEYPTYRLLVYAWKGNTLAWQDHGEFTSISAGIVQEEGNNENVVMSQAAVTEALSERDADILRLSTNVGIEEYSEYSTLKDYKIGDIVLYEGSMFKFKADHVAGEWDYNEVEEWSEKKEREEKLTELGLKVDNIDLDLNDVIFNISECETTELSYANVKNGYIYKNGSFFGNEGYRCFEYDVLNLKKKLSISTLLSITENYGSIVSFYKGDIPSDDSTSTIVDSCLKVFVSETGNDEWTNKIISIPSNATKMAVVCNANVVNKLSVKALTETNRNINGRVASCENKINGIMPKIEAIESEISNNSDANNIVKAQYTELKNGYIYKNGSFWEASGYKTAIYDIVNAKKAFVSTLISITENYGSIVSFYSGSIPENDDTSEMSANCIGVYVSESGNEEWVNKAIVVPEGAIKMAVVCQASHIESKLNVSLYTKDDLKLNQRVLINERYDRSVLYNKTVATCGDSITEGTNVDSISSDDYIQPLIGSKKKSFGYYLSKMTGCKWLNYGEGGTTLGDCTGTNGFGWTNPFAKTNGRYTKLADDLDYIIVWFGINDQDTGTPFQIEKWYRQQYNSIIYFTTDSSKYGTLHKDGTYNTLDQLNSALSLNTDTKYGLLSGTEYWRYIYAGKADDTTNETFFGAYNVVIPYLIAKYPYTKIALVATHRTNQYLRDVTKEAAAKFGLPCLDMYDSAKQLWYDSDGMSKDTYITINGESVKLSAYRQSLFTSDNIHPNDEGYRFIAPVIKSFLESI